MQMSVKQSDIEGIISAASKELEALFTEPLVKAEPPKEEEASASSPSEPSASASPEVSAEGSASASEPSAPEISGGSPEESVSAPEGLMESSESGSDSPSEEGSESSEGTPPLEETPGSPSAEPEVPGALEVVYSQLSPDLLKAHYVAIKKIIFAKHKNAMADAEMAPTDEAPLEEGQESVPPPHEEGEPDIQKAEASASASSPSEKSESSLTKNEEEQDMADLKKTEELLKEVSDLKEGFKQVQKVLELAFSRPERKAVTSLEGLAKSEQEKPLDAKEVRAKAIAITSDPEKLAKLTKSERETLLGYFDGSVDVKKIAVILDK